MMKLIKFFLVKKLTMYKGKIFQHFFKTAFYGLDTEPEPEPEPET